MRFLNKTEHEQGYEAGYGATASDAPVKAMPVRLECWQTGRYRQGLAKGQKDAIEANKKANKTPENKKGEEKKG